LRAVFAFMPLLSLARDRRGTAALEFALILPVMLLFGVGLVDTVLRNLLMIDVEMAADAGARMALRPGANQHQIADAMAGLAVAGLELKTTVFECGNDQTSAKTAKYQQYNGEDGKIIESADLFLHGGEVCERFSQGRYVRTIAAARHKSLFGTARSTAVTAISHVRLP
jgi:hypothetical protein